MARNRKTTVEFYPHYIGDGKKMFIIQQKHGNDGYATWNKLLELLAKTDNHYLDLNDPTGLMFTASYCLVSTDKLFEIIQDLVELKEIDTELWSENIIWCEKFIESIQSAYSKRANPCITRNELIQMLTTSKRINQPVKTEEKPKKTKVKAEKIENEITQTKAFDFKGALLEAGATAESVHVWLQIRKNKRAVNSEFAFKALQREADKIGWSIKDCVIKCVERSWMGFEAKYIEDSNNNKNVNNGRNNTGENREEAIRQFGS